MAKKPNKVRMLRIKADKLWSLAVRHDWNGRCAHCGSPNCEAHHLLPRGHYAYRYDLWNGIALCGPHHKFNKFMAPHMNSSGFIQWLQDHYPLRHDWYTAHKYSELGNVTVTKNVAFFTSQILTLRQRVSEEEFVGIVGVRMAASLDDRAGTE